MKLRRRGTPSRPGDRGLLLQGAAAAAEGDRGSTLSLAEGPETTGGVVGEAREEGRPALSSWSWPQTVWGASGLLVALLLALTQACWVNSIHENLLWFSQLTVRAMMSRTSQNQQGPAAYSIGQDNKVH